MKQVTVPSQVNDAQVLFVSHSGGKDSQAALAVVHRLALNIPVVLIHSDLGEMEWEPMHDFIAKNSFGYHVEVIQPKDYGNYEGFFDMARDYGRLPSGRQQFCTNELKTQPIGEFIRQYCAKNGITKAISIIGIRAQESQRRSKMNPFEKAWCSYVLPHTWKKKREELGMGNPNDGTVLEIFEWLPIFEYTKEDVLAEIKAAGQEIHPIYAKGFSRLSCAICINGRVSEHALAKELKPELFEKMEKLERELGKTIHMKQVKGKKLNHFLDEKFKKKND